MAAFKRYPHTAVVRWKAKTITSGYATAGAESTVSISCLIQPAKQQSYIQKGDSDYLEYSYNILCQTFDSNVPIDDAWITFTLDGQEYKLKIVSLHKYDYHAEIKC